MKKYEECFEHLIVLNEILPEDETKKDLEALLQIITEEVNDNNPVDKKEEEKLDEQNEVK